MPTYRGARPGTTGWGSFTLTGGALDGADHCQQAPSIADAASPDEIRAQADTCLAQIHVFSGNLEEAIVFGGRALGVFEERKSRLAKALALAQLSPAANALGQWESSFSYCRRAL